MSRRPRTHVRAQPFVRLRVVRLRAHVRAHRCPHEWLQVFPAPPILRITERSSRAHVRAAFGRRGTPPSAGAGRAGG